MPDLLKLIESTYTHLDALTQVVVRFDNPHDLGKCRHCDGPTEVGHHWCRPCMAQLATRAYLMNEHASALAANLLALMRPA